MASISDKLVRLFFTNCEVDFFNSSFVRISQRVLWQSIYFWRIVWYHAWLSRSDFNNLRYWSQSFFIRQLLAVDLLTIGAVNTGLDCSLALHTWSRNLTGVTNQFVRLFFTNAEINFFYTSFICISQRILWQSVCFWCIIRYHIWFSRTNLDDLRYWSQSFFIRKLLAVNFLTVGTIDTSLNSALSLDTWSCNLTGVLWQLISILFQNIEGYFFNTGFVRVGQWILWQSLCFWCIVRYHMRLSCSDFDDLHYWSESFLI